MKKLFAMLAATVILATGLITALNIETASAVGDVSDKATEQGPEVSGRAIGDPHVVPEIAPDHGDEVSDIAAGR